jgi:hypothetical protein
MATQTKANPPVGDQDTSQDDDVVEMVVKDFNRAWEYTNSSWHKRWEDNYKLYNNRRVKYGYIGISDTFVPMTFSTVETLVSALFGNKPKFDYIPPNKQATANTDILNGLIDFYWDKDQWNVKTINTGRGMVREGTAVDYFYWNIDHPVLINVPIRDFFIDPNAFELSERATAWCGRRYLTTLEELESFEVVDLDGEPDKDGTPKMKKKYQNLDKLKGQTAEDPVKGSGLSPGDQKTDKQEKDMWYGSTISEPQKDQVEVIEYWTVDKVISIANRSIAIEDTENYYKAKDRANGAEFPQGILPFADCRNYIDASLFYAKSDVDFIGDQQEDLNDFSNQEKDAVSMNLNQMKTLDPKYAHMLAEIENLPGAIIPVESTAFVPVPNGVIPPEAFNERMNIKNEMRETTASDQLVKGVAETNANPQTATAVNAQMAGAGQRINLKVTQLENGYFYRMAKIVFRMTQLYVTEPMMVRILGKEGAEWQEFDPKKFKGNYEPRVQLDITVQQKKQQQATDAANLLKAFLNDPNVNQRELTKLVLQRGFDLDSDEVTELLVPDPMKQAAEGGMPPMPAGMPGAPMPAGAMPPVPGQPPIPGQVPAPTGPPPKQPFESIVFKDVVAAGAIDSAAAMLQQAGLPANDIQAQKPAPGQVVGGKVAPPQPTAPPGPNDMVPHPVTGMPVMYGTLNP